MAKTLLVLLSLFAAASISAAHLQDSFVLHGSVYCDTCRCGFETDASKPIIGAVVKVVCKDRINSQITYMKEGVTDSKGKYQIVIDRDCGEDYCDAVLVKSPEPECNKPDAGRDRARVILTHDNGMNSDSRFANAMGFSRNTALPSCAQILQKYQDVDDEEE